jgi:predicted molibdopterin-dependent oxidoreductase YjgC
MHLLLGAIGKPGAGLLLMAGQPSAMANRETDAGGSYLGYHNLHSEAQMRDLCERWNLDFDKFHREIPKDILLMMEIAERGEIEYMWVIGTNPLISVPDQNRSERILRRLFWVGAKPVPGCGDGGSGGHLLSGAIWGEKKCCVTNADRTPICYFRPSNRREKRGATSTSSSRPPTGWASRTGMARR